MTGLEPVTFGSVDRCNPRRGTKNAGAYRSGTPTNRSGSAVVPERTGSLVGSPFCCQRIDALSINYVRTIQVTRSRRLSNIDVAVRRMRSDPLLQGLVRVWSNLDDAVRVRIADIANDNVVDRAMSQKTALQNLQPRVLIRVRLEKAILEHEV